MFLRGALYRDSATLEWVLTKTVSMPPTMPPAAAGIVWNNDMVIDKVSGGYFSSVMAVTEEVCCYAFVYENIINQNVLGGLKTICHFDSAVWENCA